MRLRIANSGPEAKPVDAGALLGAFATYIEQSTTLLPYFTPDESPLYSALIETDPVIPGTAARVVLARPNSAPPSGYRWAILAHFTACVRMQNTDDETPINIDVGLQLQLSEDNSTFSPLSTTLSATALLSVQDLEATADAVESVALHGTRVFATDTWQGDEGIVVRAAWGCPTADGRARINGGDEGETGGWDLTAQWVLTPINEVPPPSP